MEQEILRVHFVPNVQTGEVEPFLPQYGGVQGDRNAAAVVFTVPESLQGEGFHYRIEGEDGAGGFVTTAPLPLDDDGCVTTLLDERFTAAGGQILVRLVVSEVQNDCEVSTVRSFDGRVFFADAPTRTLESPFKDTLSALLARTDERMAHMDETAEVLTEKVDECNARVAASEGMIAQHGTRLATAEETLTAHGTRLTALENETEELDAWVSDLSDALSEFKGIAETKESEPTPWKFIQKIVRAGLASQLFSVGDVLRGTHSEYGVIEWEIIGFDQNTPLASDQYTHSMTLQAKYGLHRADGAYDLKAYDVADDTHPKGVADWETCDLRTWLNSKAPAGGWHTGEVAPPYAAQDGFMRGLSESFVEAIGTVRVPITYDSSHAESTGESFDKIFLVSRSELYGGAAPIGITDGTAYERYGADHSSLPSPSVNADQNRVKILDGEESVWWTRSVHPRMTESVARIRTDGSIEYVEPSTAGAVAPACCII